MSALDSKLFSNYWNRKRLLQEKTPSFQLKKWWPTPDLCEIEKIYFQIVSKSQSVLDVGAGDLRLKNKFTKNGFNGEYHTQDISEEFEYTYSSLDQIKRKYSVVLCLDVLEHMPLEEGLALLEKIVGALESGGTLILQTPNARCIRNPLSWDITHRHCYNLPDLWAIFTASGFETLGYRVVFKAESGFLSGLKSLLGRFIITRFLGCDYADNIAIIANKRA